MSYFKHTVFIGQKYGICRDLCAKVWLYILGYVRACGFMCIREVRSRSPAVRSDLLSGLLSSIGILTFTVVSNTHSRAVADIKTQLGSHALNNAAGKCIAHTLNAHSLTSQYVKSSPKASVFAYVWVYERLLRKDRGCRYWDTSELSQLDDCHLAKSEHSLTSVYSGEMKWINTLSRSCFWPCNLISYA